MIQTFLTEARAKFTASSQNDKAVNSAVEHMMRKELAAAQKEGRKPEYDSPAVQDEIMGFLIAGHETTSITVGWGLKFLTSYPRVQQKLRDTMFTYHADAVANKTTPSAETIAKADMPYFDAVLEEMLRCGLIAPLQSRQALVDTEMLGHRIPKGTDVFIMTNGPGVLSPPFKVDESTRSPSARVAKDHIGVWDTTDMGVFDPERWLRRGENGGVQFDAQAGPHLPFGAGVRGCFGQ